MALFERIRARGMLVLFLGTALLIASASLWLGWRLVQQDRALEIQSIRDRLETAADLVAAELRGRLARIEDRLLLQDYLGEAALDQLAAREARQLAGDALVVVFETDGIRAFPPSRLLYYPTVAGGRAGGATPAVFVDAERQEFRTADLERAARAYRRLATAEDREVRAGALMRLARVLRKRGRLEEALDAYGELWTLDATPVAGLPAGLVALHGRCATLQGLGRVDELAQEASTLRRLLLDGGWAIRRPAFLYYMEQADAWSSDRHAVHGEQGGPSSRELRLALALAATVEELWSDWQRAPRGSARAGTRRGYGTAETPVLVIWSGGAERAAALVAGPGFIHQDLLEPLRPVLERQRVHIGLTDDEGRFVIRQFEPTVELRARRLGAEAGLPWTLHVVPEDPDGELDRSSGRRRLLMAGFALVAVLVVAGSYFSGRAVNRELEAAGLQSEFVAAVSHEFRTPLTSLRQVTEALREGRAGEGQARQRYYDIQLRAAGRLQRLVEGLLDFGRMEAGAREFEHELVHVGAWLHRLVDSFRSEVPEHAQRIEWSYHGRPGGRIPKETTSAPSTDPGLQPDPGDEAVLRGDAEALERALWNLLDNAVKYSAAGSPIRVEAAVRGDHIVIGVRDQGVGIQPNEQDAIFRKFTRGSAAASSSATGTGLGLAMVRHIVEAHGGSVEVTSTPGEGSTFTMRLPLAGG